MSKKINLPRGTSGARNQCEGTFTFNIDLPTKPFMTFRCMREKHEDGKHEFHAISEHGWEYRVSWDEPKYAQQKSAEELFTGKQSKAVQ